MLEGLLGQPEAEGTGRSRRTGDRREPDGEQLLQPAPLPRAVERLRPADHQHAPAVLAAEPRQEVLLLGGQVRRLEVREHRDAERGQLLQPGRKPSGQLGGVLDVLVVDRLVRRAADARELQGGVVAEGEVDELVVPGQCPLREENAHLLLVGDADRRGRQVAGALQPGHGRREQLDRVGVDPLLVLGDVEPFEPDPRALAGADCLLLVKLTVAEQEEFEGGQLPLSGRLELGRDAELLLGRHGGGRRGLPQGDRPHARLAAEPDPDKRHALVEQGRECPGVVAVLGRRAVGQRDDRQGRLLGVLEGVGDRPGEVRPLAVGDRRRELRAVGRLGLVGEQQRSGAEAGGLQAWQQLVVR